MPYQRADTCNIIVPNSITRLVNWKSTHKEFEKQFLDDSSEEESVWTGSFQHSNLGCESLKKSNVSENSSSSSSSESSTSSSSSESEEDQNSKTDERSKKKSSRGSSEKLSESEEFQSSNSPKKPPKSPISKSSCERDDALSPNLTPKPPKSQSPRSLSESEGAVSPDFPEKLSPSTITGDSSKFEEAPSLNSTEIPLSNNLESLPESKEAQNSFKKPSNSLSCSFSESEETLSPNLSAKLSKSKRSFDTSTSSSEYEDGQNPNLTPRSSHEQNDSSLENSLVNIDFDENDCVFIEDLEDDDEIFVLQCPKGIDLSSFKDQVVFLNGESSLKLKSGKNLLHYESYAEKEDLGRILKVVLPSRATRTFSIHTSSLAGSLVLSESMDLPEAEISIEPPAKIPLPEHLKRFFEETSEHCEPNSTTTEALISSPDSIRKKKKKKRRNSNNDSFIQKESSKIECLQVENSETIPKRKKKRRKLEKSTEMNYNEVEMETSVVDVDSNRIKKKKKKKKK